MSPLNPTAIAAAAALMVATAGASAQQAPSAPKSEPAQAQKEGAAAEGSAAATGKGAQLDAVVVTARRVKERLLDVPLSVQAVTGAQVEKLGIADPLALSQAAPSLQVGDQNNYSVRGVGTLNSGGGVNVEGAVAVAIDGVNLGRASMGNMLFADIDAVEVLSGPQGMLFGKNASAGLVNISTARPVLGATEGQVRVDLARRTSGAKGNGATLQGVFNTPVSQSSALRINVFGTEQDPLVQQRGPATGSDLGERQRGIKLKYLLKATPDVELYLIGDYVERHGVAGTPFARTWRSIGSGGNPQVPPPTGLLAADGITAGPDNVIAQADSPSNFNTRSSGLQAELGVNLGGGYRLVNLLAHRRYDELQRQDGDGMSIDAFSLIEQQVGFKQTSNELRIVSPRDGALDWQAGLYAFKSTLDRRADYRGQLGLPFQIVPGSTYNIGGHADSTLDNTSLAAFGQGTYKISDAFRFTAGLRYTRDRNDFELAQDPAGAGLIVLTPTLSPSPATAKANANNVSYRFGPQWYLDADTMLYATYARGYKGPGFNAQSSQADLARIAVRPETVKSFEIGAKTALLGRKLQIQASLFRQDFTDLQVESLNTVTNSFVTQNSARAISQGAELQVTWRPTSAWRVNGSATLLDAKFKSFPGAQCYTGQVGCNPDGTFDASGVRLPVSPKATLSAQVEYRTQLNDKFDLVWDGSLYHRSAVNFSLNGAPGMSLGAATTAGLGVSLSDNEAGWTARLYCRNCFDQRTPMSISPDAGEANSGRASYLQQWGYASFRTVGVSFDYRF